MENINFTISTIQSYKYKDKTENLKRTNIQKCVNWCSKYKLPHNKNNLLSSNIFLISKKKKIEKQKDNQKQEKNKYIKEKEIK